MHLVSRLRRITTMTIVLLGLLAGLGVASAQADAPILTGGGGRQTPRVAEQTPGISPSSTPDAALSSPSPIQTFTPLSPATPNPDTPSSTIDNPESAPAKSADKTHGQAAHVVRFDPAEGSKPTQSTVKTGTLATPPLHNPQRPGFQFDGWTHDGQPFDFQTPILQDTTLKAKWTQITDWTLSPDHGPASGALLTISPPSPQEPYYTSVQAKGEQILGLTGDGRIYTWTQDSTPVQVPFPAQAPAGFRYLQVATGSRWHAALGSDQHIYTWASGQHEPATLDTNQNARFTSISLNDYLLLAVDRQGQVHTFQASDADSQNQNPKLMQQAATSLPGQAAVSAVASTSRILIVDADGQAWTQETSSTKKAEPEHIKQNPKIRIIQAQVLSKGFLLLEADGQAWYLDNNATNSAVVRLPEGMKAGRIACNGSQAVITDTDGYNWAWKPGETPMRADNRNQQYTLAVSINGRVTAVDRQGDIFSWEWVEQDQPGKPARLDTTTAPTLESASMGGQPLKLYKTDGAWRADILARQPGQATILIAGSQDGQPFTRSLNYTVDQPLTRDDQQGPIYEVDFDINGGSSKPDPQSVTYPLGRVQRPSPNPTREGYQFDGWFIGEVAYDFSRPVTDNLTLTARWTPNTQNNQWSISPDKGSQLGNATTTITPPASRSGIKFSQVSGSIDSPSDSGSGFSLAVGSDGNAYAWGLNNYGQLGDGTTTSWATPIRVKKPAGMPANFTYMQVSVGMRHSLAVGSDGYVYAWGNNNYGQLGNNSSGSSYVPVRVRDPANPTDTSKGLKAVQISAGSWYSLAVGSDGYVYAWGNNKYGQLGNNSSGSSYVPVRVRDPANPTDTSKGLKAVQISAGCWHSLAVDENENTWSWGYNDYGQLGNNTTNSSTVPVRVRDPANPTDKSKGLKATQVSGGGDHSLAVDKGGNTWSWGRNDHGELGNGHSTGTRVPGPVQYPKNDGTVTATQVSAGTFHSLAVDKDGNTWSWGWNNYGQLGNNTATNSSVPVRVRDPANPTDRSKGLKAVQISGGWYHSLAIGADGNAKAWGGNGDGQLGDGTTNTKRTPVPVVFNLTPVITGVRLNTTGTGVRLVFVVPSPS